MVATVNSLPASTSLLEEINAVGEPNRNKDQDGTIGNAAHQKSNSDHNPDETGNTGKHHDADDFNEVHARDADARGPWKPGWSMLRIVLTVLAFCRAGLEHRLLYIIYDGWIYEASNDWRKRKYTGADQHHEHAHFSFVYASGSGPGNPENDTSPWGISRPRVQVGEEDMPDLNEIFNTDGSVPTPSNASDVKKNPKRSLAESLSNIEYHVRAAEAAAARIGALETTVRAYMAADAKDAATKDAALSALRESMTTLLPSLSSAVAAEVSKLNPQAEVSQEQLNTAVLAGLKTLFQA